MDRKWVYDIARLPPVSRCGSLVGRQVRGMQNITEKGVTLSRKESESTIVNPFVARAFAHTLNFGFPLSREELHPCELKTAAG